MTILKILWFIVKAFWHVCWFFVKWTLIIIGCLIGVIAIGDVIYGRWLENQHRRNILYQIDYDLRGGRINRDDYNKLTKTL